MADPDRPLTEAFRKVSAYVRTATNGNQVPQIVSDWTSDIVLGARDAAKVTYNIHANNEKQALSKADEQLLVRSVSGYSRFKGDFIVKASAGVAENYDLSDADKQRAKELGSINGFSLAYDLDRDGREEILHIYFRQVNYVIVLEKDGVRTEVDACFGGDEVSDVEVALRDINGDRRPEVWIAYDTGTNWSTFCILQFRGVPGLDNRRRGNTGQGYGGTEVFRTLLRGGAGWSVTVGTDHSIKACAGSNCHSPATYAFDGERFRLLSSELDDDVAISRNRPFRDEKERAAVVYAAYRQAAKPVAAGPFKATSSPTSQTTKVMAELQGGGIEFGYTCDRNPADTNDALYVSERKGAGAAKVNADGRLSYPENLPVVPVMIDTAACPARVVATYEQNHHVYFAPETAERCIPLLANARTVTLPLLHGERALLEVRLPQDGSRRLMTEARDACRSGQVMREASNIIPPQRSSSETPPRAAGSAASRQGNGAPDAVRDRVPAGERGLHDGESGRELRRQRRLLQAAAQPPGYRRRQGSLFGAMADAHLRDGSGNPADHAAAAAAGRYEIAFEYTFRVANAKEAKDGRGVTRLLVGMTGDTVRILSEDGEVLPRN